MDYLFTERDTALLVSYLVYATASFIQLQKIVIANQLGQSIPALRSIWIIIRTVIFLPLLWMIRLFV